MSHSLSSHDGGQLSRGGRAGAAVEPCAGSWSAYTEASARGGLGLVETANNMIPAAIELFKRAQAISAEIGDRADVGVARRNIGAAYACKKSLSMV